MVRFIANKNNANIDQISFIIDIMHGYDKHDLFEEKIINVKMVNLEKQSFNKNKKKFLQ